MTRARRNRGERGASIVELALITPVMVLIVMGVLDLARAYQLQIRMENAAREGAAYAQIYPNRVDCAGTDDITGRILNEQSGAASLPNFRITVLSEDPGGNLTVPVTGCADAGPAAGERVRVEVSSDYALITPMVAKAVKGPIVVTGAAEIEVQG